jgi:hypothetical protein
MTPTEDTDMTTKASPKKRILGRESNKATSQADIRQGILDTIATAKSGRPYRSQVETVLRVSGMGFGHEKFLEIVRQMEQEGRVHVIDIGPGSTQKRIALGPRPEPAIAIEPKPELTQAILPMLTAEPADLVPIVVRLVEAIGGLAHAVERLIDRLETGIKAIPIVLPPLPAEAYNGTIESASR